MNWRNLVVGVVVLGVAGVAFLTMGGQAWITPQPTPTPLAALNDLDNLVAASGTLVPAKRANLGFQVAGKVALITVKPNDVVKRGDVLLKLDATQEEAAIAAARAALAQVRAGPTKEEIAVAQANLETAKAQLAKVRAPATAEDVQAAQAVMIRADANARAAQAEYDKVRGDPQVGMLPQSQALHLATQEYRVAEARYRQVLKGATPEDIRIAETNVATAQAALMRAQLGARPEDIAAAQAKVEQAIAAISVMTLTAPFAGTIAAVNIKEGETATPGVALITLGDLTQLRLETDDLSETNIARIKLGHATNVTFDALPGKIFPGTVTYIAPIAAAKQGGTNYTIYVEFPKLDPALRWGMTGHIEINTKQ